MTWKEALEQVCKEIAREYLECGLEEIKRYEVASVVQDIPDKVADLQLFMGEE